MWAPLAPPVPLALSDSPVRQALEERWVSQAPVESGVWQVSPGEREPQVPRGHLGHQGQRERPGPLDSKETRETLEQVCPGPVASVGSQVSGVKMAGPARRDPEDSWGPRAAGASVGRRVTPEPQGSRVTRVTQPWLWGPQGHGVPKGTWANEGFQA